ncbi:MAG: pyruvate kinase [Bacilli bacterium]|nr:pyruvate kinase [Bacilli bacterium]
MNKTKIIATVGPSSCSKEVISDLIKNGVDVIRINMKHANYTFCEDIINKVNTLNDELNTNVAIMLDIKGPNMTVGKLINKTAFLKKGDRIRLHFEQIVGDNTKFSVNNSYLLENIKYNSEIKINNGSVTLNVLDKGKGYLLCEVIDEGIISENKSIIIPGLYLSGPFLDRKDISDIKFADKMKVDFLGLSYVQSADNVLEVNDLLIGLGNDHIGTIAKIENEYAVNEIEEIVKASEGIMVARGDLGIELPIERVPGIQKKIIKKCHQYGKVSIVATEMLSSMKDSNIPTRAEVSDVANAVLDGADAVMLSNETTIGCYPVETIEMMEKIIKAAEVDVDYMGFLDASINSSVQDITGIISYNVAESANRLKCKAIIAPTVTGYTARKISKFRPSCPIIAATPNKETIKSLALHFGVFPILVQELKSFDGIITHARKITKDMIATKEGDRIVITGGYPFKETKHTNFMKIEEL